MLGARIYDVLDPNLAVNNLLVDDQVEELLVVVELVLVVSASIVGIARCLDKEFLELLLQDLVQLLHVLLQVVLVELVGADDLLKRLGDACRARLELHRAAINFFEVVLD